MHNPGYSLRLGLKCGPDVQDIFPIASRLQWFPDQSEWFTSPLR